MLYINMYLLWFVKHLREATWIPECFMHQPQIELKSFVVERHLCLNTICFYGSLPCNVLAMLRFAAKCVRLGLDASSSSWSFFDEKWRGGLDGCRCLGGRSGEVLGRFSLTGNFSWEMCLIVLIGGQMKYLYTWNTWNASKKGLTKWCCFGVDYKTALSSVWNCVIEKQLILDLKP